MTLTPAKEWRRPAQKAEDFAAPALYVPRWSSMPSYCDEIKEVLEFFTTRVEAETMLGRVLADEPDWRDVLHVEPIELVTAGGN